MNLSINQIHSILLDSILYNKPGLYYFSSNNINAINCAFYGLHNNIRLITTTSSLMPFLHYSYNNMEIFKILRLKNELDIRCTLDKNKIIMDITKEF